MEGFTGKSEGLDGDFALDVIYSDWAGTQRVRARVFVSAVIGGMRLWKIYRIDYHRLPQDELITSVEFA
jgi:hypothetical protein